jgi:hypothetical protein
MLYSSLKTQRECLNWKKKPWPLSFYKASKLLYFRLTLNNSILHAAAILCRIWPAQPCSPVVLSSILSFPARIIDLALRREATFQLASLCLDTVHLLNKSAVDKVSSVIPTTWLERGCFTTTDELKDFGTVCQALIKELQWKWFDIVIFVKLTVQGAQRGETRSLTTRMQHQGCIQGGKGVPARCSPLKSKFKHTAFVTR